MRKRMVLLILILLNLATIFFFSHQNSVTSARVSNRVSGRIVVHTRNYAAKNQSEKNIFRANFQSALRRAAHVILFFTLGALVQAFVATFFVPWYCSVVTALFGFLCALGDELHQMFVPGRTAQCSDVMYDMLGVVLGILLMRFIGFCVSFMKNCNKKGSN